MKRRTAMTVLCLFALLLSAGCHRKGTKPVQPSTGATTVTACADRCQA